MRHEIWQITPELEGVDFSQAIDNLTLQLKLLIKDEALQAKIISLTFFIATKKENFAVRRQQIISKIREVFDNPPAYSIIGQAPASNDLVSLEVSMIIAPEKNVKIQYLSVNQDIALTKVETDAYCEYYFSGITAEEQEKSMVDKISGAYKMLDNKLNELGLGMNNIIRQWNYVEDIVSIYSSETGELQNYQLLNNVRHEFYHRYNFINGYPAATGIGMSAGGFILECIAIKEKSDLKIAPLANPDQISAYEYSENVLIGKQKQLLSTPKFERAKLYSYDKNQFKLLISGTAAIHNEQSLATDNIVEQTRITLENINKLKASASEQFKIFDKHIIHSALSYLRIYIKNKNDFAQVKKICDEYARDVKPVYLIADICREELLIEIEGIIDIITG